MNTFLLIWNKDKSRWISFDVDHAKALQEGHLDPERSCDSGGLILKSSRVFLEKQGKEHKGIIASGIVLS